MSVHWQLYLTAEDFARLRADPRLGALVALGRITNALTLIAPVHQTPLDWSVPRIRRERTSSLFYISALLHEGLHVAQSLGAHFRHLPEYKDLAALQGDPEVIELRRRLLKPLRDKAVFHFDPAVSELVGSLEATGDVVLVSGIGDEVGDTYMDFADTAVLHFVLDSQPANDESVWSQFRTLADRASRLYASFMLAAHRLMPAAYRDLGVRQRVLAGK